MDGVDDVSLVCAKRTGQACAIERGGVGKGMWN